MKRSLTIIMAVLLLLPAITSCVHEWPDETTPADIVLDLKFNTDLPPHLTVNYVTKISDESKLYDVRYTIEAYRCLPSGEYNETADQRMVYTKDDVEVLDYSASADLPEGKYKIVAWVDYVVQGSVENLFYDITDFREVTFKGNYVGNSDYRDAFIGETEVEVVRLPSDSPAPVYTLQMGRPLAKYDIIATDMEEFITKQLEILRQQMAQKSEDEENDGTKGDETKVPIEIDLNDYTVKVSYVGYVPNTFNIHKNRPVDASVGYSYTSKIKDIENGAASMGFDYYFVNGKESIVTIVIEVFDKQEKKIAGTLPIEVPVIRSKLTTVKGKFLTSEATGGVGISPGFEGELNYPVQ